MWTKETLMGRFGWKSRVNEVGTGLFNNRLRAYIPDGNTFGGVRNMKPDSKLCG